MIKYYSRAIDDNTHLYKYDDETGTFYYMDHCWTGEGQWYRREGSFPPEFSVVEISLNRALEICKGNIY